VVPAFGAASARLKASRPFKAWQRYKIANGNLLAAGVAYFAFFSIFPAMALALAIFGFILQDRPDILQTLVDSLNETFPGMVKTPDNPTGIITVQAPSSVTLTLTGLISAVVLLFAGLGWVGALRTGIRGLFGLKFSDDTLVLRWLRDVFALVTLGLAILASAIVTSTVGGWAGTVAEWLGRPTNGAGVTAAGFLLGVAFDTVIMVILLRMMSRVPLPWHNVRDGALFGAAAITVLKLVGGALIGHVTSNPLLGAVAVSVGLLFWLNLMSRVVLLSAAWAATNVEVEQLGTAGVGPAMDRMPGGTAAPESDSPPTTIRPKER
jgi:membrane protein